MFEVWKDDEMGHTYKVKGGFDTYYEAMEYLESIERYYLGWHLRVKEA